MSYSPIKLDQIAPPDVVETLDFEAILAALHADLLTRAPELAPVMALESDPLAKLLEVSAYREMVLRARINDAARGVMLATARGSDLDHLAALLGVQRLIVTPGDADAVPPVPPVLEADDALRHRTQLSLEGFTSAGSRGAYEFHARSASAEVADVAITSPQPGTVLVTVLSATEYGASAQLLAVVSAALTAETVRPLCDKVMVQAPAVMAFAVQAEIVPFSGPDAAVVMAAARAALDGYLADARRVGRDITRSAIFAALHRPGVARVKLIQPAADLDVGATSVARCTSVTLTQGAPE